MSSLKDLASLIMIPSLYKDGRLDTVKPLGNSIIHPDATGNNDGTDGTTPAEGNFTFSRGSNLAATRVDVNGLIEKGRENLLLQSNQFDTTWSNVLSGSITSGQSGYDGTNNAWKLSKGATAYRYIIQSLSVSGVYTYSLYAKADTLNQVTIFNDTGGSSPYAKFSLVDGSVVASSGLIDSSATDAGNGWWRLSATFNTTITTARIYPDFAETTAGNIYIQDAQLEAGLVATDYIETGASTAQAGILEDMPRLDYSGSCPALLLEPQRTNVLPQSEYYGGSGWDASAYPVTITSNSIISPDGNSNATLITPTSGNSRHAIREISISAVSGATYTLSVFFKKGGSRYVVFGDGGDTLWRLVTADLDNGVITDESNASGTITPFANGWYRITCQITRGNSGLIYFLIGASETDSNSTLPSFNNTSLTTYSWGAQVESNASYPTSYIPTYGSSVTRSNEYFTTSADLQTTGILGSTWTFLYDNTYVDVPRDTTSTIFQITDGIGNYVRITLNIDGILRLQDSEGTIANSTNNKIVGRYDGTKIEFFGDGESKGSRVEGSGYDYSNLNAYSVSTLNSKTIKLNQLVFFPTALTDSECIALTTL